uniref:Uncharacterized protein n=1 Tax=Anguilla anguilla TaxID=7936 RepID=A0A0E9WIV0_ANGAN
MVCILCKAITVSHHQSGTKGHQCFPMCNHW